MDLLFTGGVSLEPKPPKPLTFSQIRLKFCGQDKINERAITTTPKYSNKVLIGNWYEERSPPMVQNHYHWTTDYKANYVPHDVKNIKAEMYALWKQKQKAQRGEQELSDDEDSDMRSKYKVGDRSKRNHENDDPNSRLRSSYQMQFEGVTSPPDKDEKSSSTTRVDMNTPDLRHLGIDLSSKSRPPAREPQYRRVGSKKMCTWL